MITTEKLLSAERNDLPTLSKELDPSDLDTLVDWLSEKDDKIRYQSLLLLQCRAKHSADLYRHWSLFKDKMTSENSYQRSIGLMMIAANVKWDKYNRFEQIFDEYCVLLNDEKLTTVRQCIQSFEVIVPFKPLLSKRISETLTGLDIMNVKETMRKSLLLDIINVLILIRKSFKTPETEYYISNALMGGILDDRSKKSVQAQLLA